MISVDFPWLVPADQTGARPRCRSRMAARTAKIVKQAAGYIPPADVEMMNFMLRSLGFDSFWDSQVSAIFEEYRKGFSEIMKELYKNPRRKYEERDFYDWVVCLLSRGYMGFGEPDLALRNFIFRPLGYRDWSSRGVPSFLGHHDGILPKTRLDSKPAVRSSLCESIFS